MMTTEMKIVRLAACSDVEYAEFVPMQIAEYARQLVQAGEVPPQEGLGTARERLADLAADRLRSAGHDFLVATSAPLDVRVGWVWLSPAPASTGTGRARWLSQLTVLDPHRG